MRAGRFTFYVYAPFMGRGVCESTSYRSHAVPQPAIISRHRRVTESGDFHSRGNLSLTRNATHGPTFIASRDAPLARANTHRSRLARN